jgi:hypothetical protein
MKYIPKKTLKIAELISGGGKYTVSYDTITAYETDIYGKETASYSMSFHNFVTQFRNVVMNCMRHDSTGTLKHTHIKEENNDTL